MPRHTEDAYYPSPLDTKARRKRLDERRMHFRRAIERYDEQRRLQHELDDYPDLLAISLRPVSPPVFRQNARPAR
ncbi:PA3496 family putative envelope integrity protein [Azotobacter armeniacus]